MVRRDEKMNKARWCIYVVVGLVVLLIASRVCGDVVPWVQVDVGMTWGKRFEWDGPADPGLLVEMEGGIRVNVGRWSFDPYLGYLSMSQSFNRPFEDKYTVGGRIHYGPVWIRLEHFCIHPVVSSYEWDHSGTTYKQSRGRQENRTSITIGTKLELK